MTTATAREYARLGRLLAERRAATLAAGNDLPTWTEHAAVLDTSARSLQRADRWSRDHGAAREAAPTLADHRRATLAALDRLASAEPAGAAHELVGVNATRGGSLRRLALVALATVLIGCVSGPDTSVSIETARIGSDGATHLRRAADNIEQGLSDLNRSAEHRRRAATAVADAWPELAREIEPARAAVDKRSRDDALLREVAGQLREIADGSPVPPAALFVDLAGFLRDEAVRLRNVVHEVSLKIESSRTARVGEGGSAVVDRAMVESVDAMRDAADRYGWAAAEIDRVARAVGWRELQRALQRVEVLLGL